MTTTTTTTRDTTALSDITKIQNAPDGNFKRVASTFRDFIEEGGRFAPERDRYHLYVSYACPWATRTLIVRKLKGLEDIIRDADGRVPRLGSDGWPFGDADPLIGARHVKDLYLSADPEYASRFTVPVLWDKKLNTVVNNESAEIVRIFNSAFNSLLPADKAALDLYPAAHRAEIDELNEWVYSDVNSAWLSARPRCLVSSLTASIRSLSTLSVHAPHPRLTPSLLPALFSLPSFDGVYRAGFATAQEAYETAVTTVFAALDRLEARLTGKDFLVGGQLTEADVRLFVTIVRFDTAYVGQFKCNIQTIRGGYPAIHAWLRKLYWTMPAFKDSTRFDHIKACYYGSQPNINPTRIVPVGPLPPVMPL
ncbi:glutathione S-transferase [Mycena sp. CBHHK59/15]|nr:glutathione S-transferase [Mycena sp. CBHHK59/15]